MGDLFKFKRTTFETLGSGAEFRRRSSGKTSSLKFTKYDCANLPKIFLAKNFE